MQMTLVAGALASALALAGGARESRSHLPVHVPRELQQQGTTPCLLAYPGHENPSHFRAVGCPAHPEWGSGVASSNLAGPTRRLPKR